MTGFPNMGMSAADMHAEIDREHERDLQRAAGLMWLVFEWCYDGTFTIDQVRAVCEAYNGEPCTHDHQARPL